MGLRFDFVALGICIAWGGHVCVCICVELLIEVLVLLLVGLPLEHVQKEVCSILKVILYDFSLAQ